MSTATRFQGASRRRIQHFGNGAKVVRREVSSLVNPNTGGAVTTLAVQGLTANGATSIILDAAAMIGKFPTGAAFTIAGDATTYTLTADATASSNAVTCSINALQAQAADDAVVTVTQPYGEKTYKAKRSRFRADEVGVDVGLDDFKLELATPDEFSKEDKNVTFDGANLNIAAVVPFSPGTEQASVTLHCKG